MANAATLTLATVVQNESNQAGNARSDAGRFWTPRSNRRHGRSAGAVHRRGWLPPASAQPQRWPNPALWSVDAPNLYSAIVTVEADGKPRDAERVTFGVRTADFDRGQGILPEWQAAQDPGHLQPPGSRRRGRGAA